MINDSLRTPSRSAQTVWLLLLVLAGLGAGLTLSCIAPFAALAVALAGTVRLRVALCAITAIWLSNQFVGFVFYHFPCTWNTALWGLAIGGAALLTTLVSEISLRRTARFPAVARLALVLTLSYVSYEISLFAAALVLGGTETFSPLIFAKIALINATWLVVLVGLNELMSMLCSPWLGTTPRLIKAGA